MSNSSVTDEQAHRWLQQIADQGWVSLHYDNPSLGGPDRAELSGGGYQRFKMSWSQPNNRAIWSLVDAKFTGLVQSKLSYFGVWTGKGANDFLRAYGELPNPVVILAGKGYILHARLLVISFG